MTASRRLTVAVFMALACTMTARPAAAQAPINSNVALQPSRGGLVIRQQFRYTQSDRTIPTGELEFRMATSITTFAYGLTDEVTLIFSSPFVLARRTSNSALASVRTDSGFADGKLMSKIRLFRDDFGPNSTTRFDLIGGVEIPMGHDAFTSESVDPIVGGVFTHVDGRHAFDADALWQFNTAAGQPDRFSYDGAYIYRLSPETYASTNPHGLFGSIEINGTYETNGDHELLLSPGLQLVTTLWILEATVQLPAWQSLDNRAQRDFIVGLGFRVQF